MLQQDLERDYGLHDAHCEQDVHGGLSEHFVCLADFEDRSCSSWP